MVTFTSEAQQDIPLTERRILRVLAPRWHLGWAVQFGRYFVQFPSPGDMSFYDRMAHTAGTGCSAHDLQEHWMADRGDVRPPENYRGRLAP